MEGHDEAKHSAEGHRNYIIHLEGQNRSLRAEVERLKARVHEYENEQARVLPEDVGLAEYVERLTKERVSLRSEVDVYDAICTTIRNRVTEAGIPELTEDRLRVVPLAMRVGWVITERDEARKERDSLRALLRRVEHHVHPEQWSGADRMATEQFCDEIAAALSEREEPRG